MALSLSRAVKGDPSELHSGSRPHPGRRQSQYSWAHMDPSAHSLAFRGGAEVPDEEGCYISAACVSRVQGPTTRHSYVGSTAPNSPHTYYGRGAILCFKGPGTRTDSYPPGESEAYEEGIATWSARDESSGRVSQGASRESNPEHS